MNFWLCGLMLGFATIVHIETKPNYDEEPSEHHIHTRGTDEVMVPFDPNYKPEPAGALSEGMEASRFDDEFKDFDLELEGEYFWERMYYIDNTNNSAGYHEEHKYIKEITTSYSDLTKHVTDSSLKLSRSMEGGVKFAIVSLTVKNSLDVELKSSYDKTIEKKIGHSEKTEVTKIFDVGPGDFQEMFRLVYKGPGVVYATDSTSSDGTIPNDKVILKLKVKRVPLIKNIRVVYTDQSIDRPQNLITETHGGNPDVNSGLGRYTWLVPEWTTKVEEALTNIQFVAQRQRDDNYDDLAPGSVPKLVMTYLKMLKDDFAFHRIYRVGLLRSRNYVYNDRKKHGWDQCTGNINQYRLVPLGLPIDYLHLCWNNISTAYVF